jgi:N-acetylglutamate synthase-like GNAT family acetyltransferase
MAILIEKAQANDAKEICELDEHIDRDAMLEKIDRGEIVVARKDQQILGCLRFSFFWDEIPFLNLIKVQNKFQTTGIGTSLMDAWEQEMKAAGHTKVMTSSQSNESAQHFYRKRGYKDIGEMTLPREASEIFFLKEL